MAVRRITTWLARTGGAGVAVGVGRALGLAVGLCAVVPTCREPDAADGECGEDDTRWYTTRPTSTASASSMATLQFGPRRSLILMGVAGSNTSAADMGRGVPCVSSYSRISASGSAPTARAMLRMWPRA